MSYKARIIRYESIGRQHRITIKSLDHKTGKYISKQVIKGELDRLPKNIRKFIHQEYKEQLKKSLPGNYSESKWNELADRCCKNPEYFKSMNRESRWTYKAGLDWYAVFSAITAGGLAFVFDTLTQYFNTKSVDWERAGKIGLLGALSGFVGYYSGVQTNVILTKVTQNISKANILSKLGKSSKIGGVSGGIFASVVLAYGLYVLGYSELKTANRSVAEAGLGAVAGVGVTTGAWVLVGTYGTASTGTAISTLSGVSATNAITAWFGGGSIAAGGGGMAVGAMTLSGISIAGAIIVGIGLRYINKYLDEKEQQQLITGRLKIISERVEKSIQPEWDSA